MLEKIVAALVVIMIREFPEEKVKEGLDYLIDFVEDYVEGTENVIDDAAILPLCGAVRDYFDLPDNDEPAE